MRSFDFAQRLRPDGPYGKQYYVSDVSLTYIFVKTLVIFVQVCGMPPHYKYIYNTVCLCPSLSICMSA